MNATIRSVGRGRTVPLAVLTYAIALSAAMMTGPDIGGINAGVEGLSSRAAGVPAGLGGLLPLGYAFGAGMVAAVNPCGFALLPAYVGLFLGRDKVQATRPPVMRPAHAARVGLS